MNKLADFVKAHWPFGPKAAYALGLNHGRTDMFGMFFYRWDDHWLMTAACVERYRRGYRDGRRDYFYKGKTE